MASVTIHSSSTVFPSHPTPMDTLSLSESDQSRAWTHVPTIYVYKSPTAATAADVDALKKSLGQILVPYYPLAGRLHWIAGSRLELHCCAAGAQFIEASSAAKLDNYGDFAPSDALQELAPKVDYDSPIEELPVFLVQVTRFRCGGLVICIAISHTLVDGASAITFINSWASMARGEKTVDTILQPFHDRKVLQPHKPFHAPRFHHQEFDAPPLLSRCSDSKEEEKKESIVAMLNLTKEQVEKLKKRANWKEGNSNITNENMKVPKELRPQPYSRYESITGHMWVCACKARNTGESKQLTVVRIVVDIRQRLRTPIPENFTGNSNLITLTPECEFGDLIMTRPLSFAAGKIREGTCKMTDEYVKSAMDFLASKQDIDCLRTSYHSVVSDNASFWGNPNLAVVSWMSMPLYDADFGWGRPCYVGPVMLNTDGKSYIMPGPTGDGSLIIVIRLQTRHMDDFKKFFYEGL